MIWLIKKMNLVNNTNTVQKKYQNWRYKWPCQEAIRTPRKDHAGPIAHHAVDAPTKDATRRVMVAVVDTTQREWWM